MITDQLRADIHAAMEKTGGNGQEAAALLGMTKTQLWNHIHRDPTLKANWTKKGMVATETESELIHRPALPLNVTPEEWITAQEVSDALAKEDLAFRTGLDAIGVTGERLKLVVALQQFHGRHYTRALDLIGGGITKLFTDLMVEVDKINKALESGALEPEREMLLRKDRADLIEAMGKTYDRASKAVFTQAVIKHKLQNKKESRKPKGYLNIEAHPGSKVQVVAERQSTAESPEKEAIEVEDAAQE